jgi:hypothetical protein
MDAWKEGEWKEISGSSAWNVDQIIKPSEGVSLSSKNCFLFNTRKNISSIELCAPINFTDSFTTTNNNIFTF